MTQKLFVHEDELSWEAEAEQEPPPVRWKKLINQLHTDSYGVTVGVFEVLPGKRWPKHYHPDVEVYYILAGQGQVEVGDQTQDVRPGMAIFIPGNTEHAVTNTSSTPIKLLYIFPTDTDENIEYTFLE